jgi:hypothetical protein
VILVSKDKEWCRNWEGGKGNLHFLGHNTGTFSGSQQKFCKVRELKLNTSSDRWMCFRSSVTQLLSSMSYKYAQPQIAKSATPLNLHSTDRKWRDTTAGKVYVILALFVVMWNWQKPI